MARAPMLKEGNMAEENIPTTDSPPRAVINMATAKGNYIVTASFIVTDDGRFDKGEKVELAGDVATALANEGSIKPA